MLNVDGWNAIDGVLNARYGDAERLEWDAPMPYRPMGPMPMGQFVTNTIAVYPRTEPVPHWHLIGYALTAPFEERGYEFTLRVPRLPGETAAPNWAMAHLEKLASYVSKSGNDFEPGHYIEFPDPLDPERPGSAVRAVLARRGPDGRDGAAPSAAGDEPAPHVSRGRPRGRRHRPGGVTA
ncbi:suppressor of fused domain protein [Actinomadura geliboluensis]